MGQQARVTAVEEVLVVDEVEEQDDRVQRHVDRLGPALRTVPVAGSAEESQG